MPTRTTKAAAQTELRPPHLEIRGPDGQESIVELDRERYTIGRAPVVNTIALNPAMDALAGRQGHCSIENADGAWWVVDAQSKNGTFVQRRAHSQRVNGRLRLVHGDVIRIPARFSEDGHSVLFWELAFHDDATISLAVHEVQVLEYDAVQGKLFRGGMIEKVEITGLRPQEHKLVRYMAQRNAAAGDVPVLCGFDDLMRAIWGDESETHQQEELSTIVYTLRRKVEPNPRRPQFVLLEPGFGYRLCTSPV